MAAHRDGPVPALTIGLGGAWGQVLSDTRTVPLPADPDRVILAVASLPGTATADLDAAGRVAVRLAQLFMKGGFAEFRITLTGATAVRARARPLARPI